LQYVRGHEITLKDHNGTNLREYHGCIRSLEPYSLLVIEWTHDMYYGLRNLYKHRTYAVAVWQAFKSTDARTRTLQTVKVLLFLPRAVRVDTYARMYTYTYIYKCNQNHTSSQCIFTCIHTRILIHIHIYTHTYIRILCQPKL